MSTGNVSRYLRRMIYVVCEFVNVRAYTCVRPWVSVHVSHVVYLSRPDDPHVSLTCLRRNKDVSHEYVSHVYLSRPDDAVYLAISESGGVGILCPVIRSPSKRPICIPSKRLYGRDLSRLSSVSTLPTSDAIVVPNSVGSILLTSTFL